MGAVKIDRFLSTIREQFKKAEEKAKRISNDPIKAKALVNKALIRAYSRKSELSQIWTQLKLLFALLSDYIGGRYTEIPYRSIITLFAGVLYFLSPIDAMPDFLLGFGLIDDLFILSLIINQLETDLNRYKKWKYAS